MSRRQTGAEPRARRAHPGDSHAATLVATLRETQFRWAPDGEGGMRRKTLRTPLTLALSEDEGTTWPH
ncbi:hypothetical protein ACWDWO_13755 [Actinopolymorpha singaporensis]|uniref:Uncharacterized protein n=1 Tax=Actinopolymorpha singaporensis TaxID=117157 RepID=A0A1H1V2T9_9ACTN|nr:hypothetical protein [Actinopolymorpha singaporensis]SDS79003.1 hypothetical protein SAMN04489717_3880 [Actinopolymorpha singaporensis]